MRFREILSKHLSPGMTVKQRLAADVAAQAEWRATYPDGAAARDEAQRRWCHSRAFQAADAIAIGRYPVDSQATDPRGAEKLRKHELLDDADLRKLAQSGHEERLEKVRHGNELEKSNPSMTTPARVYWTFLDVWDPSGHRLTGHAASGMLEAFRDGRLPSGYVIRFGSEPVGANRVDWSHFSERHGNAAAFGVLRSQVAPVVE
jgi:hypothetical protein